MDHKDYIKNRAALKARAEFVLLKYLNQEEAKPITLAESPTENGAAFKANSAEQAQRIGHKLDGLICAYSRESDNRIVVSLRNRELETALNRAERRMTEAAFTPSTTESFAPKTEEKSVEEMLAARLEEYKNPHFRDYVVNRRGTPEGGISGK